MSDGPDRWDEAAEHVESLLATARKLGREREPLVRRLLGEAYVLTAAVRAHQARLLTGAGVPSTGSPMWTAYRRRMAEIGLEVCGADGLLRSEPALRWQELLRDALAAAVAGDQQRDALAEQVLGLPADPAGVHREAR